MEKSERKKMAISFIEKLHEATNNKFSHEYTLKYASSTNGFFANYNCFRKEINSKLNKFTIKNYHYGPSNDHDGYPGEVWEFGFVFLGQEIYIKFRIHKKYIVCFKIHPSTKKIRYPFR